LHLSGALGINSPVTPSISRQLSIDMRNAGGFKKKEVKDTKIFGVIGAAIGK
jgi:hypothetical protein